ncbi:MAG TPA: hypothetical protein VJN18_25555 [Polyangiaceae bacterium]|nr:hypothetical protein [Polyangiaceae bacterium]
MTGWGRVCFLLAAGVFLGAGCGGRTTALDDGYGDGPDGNGADGSGADGSGAIGQGGSGPRPAGGKSSMGGRPSPGGGPSYAGTVSVGGAGIVGGYYPGGASYGGYPIAGFGGTYPTAGTGFGGNPNQPGGSCCDAQMTPSCRPTAVAKCVCQFEPYCCDKLWDEGCASLVEPLGCGYCERFDCDTCLTRSCGPQLSACYQDFGCISIYDCMRSSGCSAFQCYTEGQCRFVIDEWGGPGGYSMSLLLSAFSCSIQSGCPCN